MGSAEGSTRDSPEFGSERGSSMRHPIPWERPPEVPSFVSLSPEATFVVMLWTSPELQAWGNPPKGQNSTGWMQIVG